MELIVGEAPVTHTSIYFTLCSLAHLSLDVPGTVLSTSFMLTYIILLTTLWGTYYYRYYYYFTKEETEAQRLTNLPNITKLVSGTGKIWIQAVCFQS